jgi:beta-phosphoglucomutase-like phosphatase (HAD superfamily)
MKYSGIFFDMDGTLLETGPLWDRATRVTLDEHKIELTEEEYFSLGGKLLHHLLEKKEYDKKKIKKLK